MLLIFLSFLLSVCFSLCVPRLYLCWTEGTQPVRHRPGIFLCPSSPTLSLLGAGTAGCGNSPAPRAATSPLLSSVRSDTTLLRKSVSFNEDLLLGASGTVGLCCASGVKRRNVDTQITQIYWTVFTREKWPNMHAVSAQRSLHLLLLWPQHVLWCVWQLSSKPEYLFKKDQN